MCKDHVAKAEALIREYAHAHSGLFTIAQVRAWAGDRCPTEASWQDWSNATRGAVAAGTIARHGSMRRARGTAPRSAYRRAYYDTE